MNSEEYDIIFKTVLVGDSGVGKTNILSRYTRDEFSIETKSTIGVEFGCRNLMVANNRVKIQIWDTAGQERYKAITTAYYRGTKGALVVFDISRRDSFYSTEKYIGELKSLADADVAIVLIGNKADLEDSRQVTQEEAKAKAEQHGLAYFETSALQATNIEKAFTIMVEGKFKFY
jgi:small GTP-binding protein